MKESKKTNNKKQSRSRSKKVSKKKSAHLQAVAERKAAINEKLQPVKEKGVTLSWGSRKCLHEIDQQERQLTSKLDGSSRLFQKGVDRSIIPSPSDREGVRKRYRELIGAPAITR